MKGEKGVQIGVMLLYICVPIHMILYIYGCGYGFVLPSVGVEPCELPDVVQGDAHHLLVLRRQQRDERPITKHRGGRE